MTQKEMQLVEEKLNRQKQVNNPFVLSTDHKEGLEEYIIKHIEELPKQLTKFKEVFNPPPKGKIFNRGTKLNAKLPYNKKVVNTLPVQPHIKLNQDQEIALEKQFQELLEENKIEKCNSNHACNVFKVPKKDGTFRTVFNFVLVNNCLIPNQYPIPRLQELVNNAAKYEFHILLDLRNAYNQIYLEENYRHLTNFRFKNQIYRWKVLPFGLSTAPSIFQGILNLILKDKINKGVDVYLEDIHIYGESEEECINNCAYVLSKFQEQHLYCKLEKCIFFPKKFEYLGYEIAFNKIKPVTKLKN